MEATIFSKTKVSLKGHRIRTIKIRGVVSQGLLASLEQCGLEDEEVGSDVKERLNIKKYEPSTKNAPSFVNPRRSTYRNPNTNFGKYTDLQHLKNYPSFIKEGEPVMITEKIHGTNFRAGWVKDVPHTPWKKFKNFLGMLSEVFIVGSHNVQLVNTSKTFYGEDIYSKAAKNYKLKEKLPDNAVVYGEVYGSGVQKGYTYGCKEWETRLVIFEVFQNGRWLEPYEARAFCAGYGLPFVPVLYTGPYKGVAHVESFSTGGSLLHPEQSVREGCVVRADHDYKRRVYKQINPDYLLLKNNTDWH